MKWTDDLPVDWEHAPKDPPIEDTLTVTEWLTDGLLVHDRYDEGVYLYSSETADVVA